MRTVRLVGVAVAAALTVLVVTACDGGSEVVSGEETSTTLPPTSTGPGTVASTSTSSVPEVVPMAVPCVETTTTTVAPPPGPRPAWSDTGWGVGITIGYLPEGYYYGRTDDFFEGWEANRFFHEGEEGTPGSLSVTWLAGDRAEEETVEGEHAVRWGREFIVDRTWPRAVIYEHQADGSLIKVVNDRYGDNPRLDMVTLWQVVRSITYDPDTDDNWGFAPAGPGRGSPPDWDFFRQVARAVWTGEYVVDPERRWRWMGEMEVTLTDGRVLRFPAGDHRHRWCGRVVSEVRSVDYDDCWLVGTLDETGTVDEWDTFKPGDIRQDREVIGWGFTLNGAFDEVLDGTVWVRACAFPLADDVVIDTTCCPTETYETADDLGTGFVVYDVDRGEVIKVGCFCRRGLVLGDG
jgi:hypothetical protein